MILVVVTLRWLLQVVVRVTLTLHVVAAFAVFPERFVADLLTIVDFLVPRQQIFLVDPETRKKRIDILDHYTIYCNT